MSSSLAASLSPNKRWSGKADLRWQNEIEGTVTLENLQRQGQTMRIEHGYHYHNYDNFGASVKLEQNNMKW